MGLFNFLVGKRSAAPVDQRDNVIDDLRAEIASLTDRVSKLELRQQIGAIEAKSLAAMAAAEMASTIVADMSRRLAILETRADMASAQRAAHSGKSSG